MLRWHVLTVSIERFVARLACSACLLVLVMGTGGPKAVLADTRAPGDVERQTRFYHILIDGTKRGQSNLQLRADRNGNIAIRSESEIKINFLVYRYNYTSTGTEIWRDGHLSSVDSTSDYNGTQYVVKGAMTPRGLQITTNGTPALVSPEIWDTSYSFLPDRLARNEAGTVILLDSDQGRRLMGKIQYLGEEVLEAAVGPTRCTHFRVGGDVHVDLWFDGTRRLVRSDSQESGHKVRFELQRVSAE